MATCKRCGKSGLFLKLSKNGLCEKCEQVVIHDQKISSAQNPKILEYETNQLLVDVETANSTTPQLTSVPKFTPAQLELLSKFLKAQGPTKFTDYEGWKNTWEEVLNEPIKKVISRFINEHYLEPPNLMQLLDGVYKLADLKEFCRERGIKISGKKEEIINRLILNDEAGMKNIVMNFKYYVCSKTGKKLVEEYLETKRKEKENAQKIVLDALTKRDLRLATRTIIDYETKQVFPRGLNVNWKLEEGHYLTNLTGIFTETPTILKNIPPEKLELIRVCTGYNHLWGKPDWGLLNNIENISPKFDNPTCSMLLISYVMNKRTLRQYKPINSPTGRKNYMKIYTCNDSSVCEECKKLASKKYDIKSEIPELPNPKCTCEFGCRCWYGEEFI